ncbi:hypothetical protein GCM10011335_35410 [Aureimonas glaciei]|uniref:Uncharacterized protein n=1 Tax=Aureimonas glaciei TaxID=1776957 RepID=A0A917DDX4_9HYPH|nr:hypothetical protein GCM10011335_35410 [Aureimonas glaciei]
MGVPPVADMKKPAQSGLDEKSAASPDDLGRLTQAETRIRADQCDGVPAYSALKQVQGGGIPDYAAIAASGLRHPENTHGQARPRSPLAPVPRRTDGVGGRSLRHSVRRVVGSIGPAFSPPVTGAEHGRGYSVAANVQNSSSAASSQP